jgi:hypothetical protein
MTTQRQAQLNNIFISLSVAALVGITGAVWLMRSEISEIKGEVGMIKVLIMQRISEKVAGK